MNILEVKDLCKTYIVNKRQNNVLKNVNFTVDQGEMVAVMGPSGSGKSTLLYAVSGMDSITAGEALFCGRNIAKMGEKELADLRLNEMGFIFQNMYMLKNLTVLDNIILPAVQSKKNGETRRETVQRGRELMRKLGITDISDNDINEVSGGQLQRACICRSMINKPKMIFADEPTGALNRTSSDEVMEELAILIVSAKTAKEDKLNGLDLGADDYIEKPYDIDIMLAKISGIFKRRYAADEIVDGDIRINKVRRAVYKNDVQLEMTAKH